MSRGKMVTLLAWIAQRLQSVFHNTKLKLNCILLSFSIQYRITLTLEKANKVGLSSLLKSQNCWSLEPQVSLEILSNLSNKSLKRKFSDQKISRLLVSSNLTKCDGARSVSVWFLYTSCGRGRLPGSFGCQLLSWSLTSSRFSCSLLTGRMFGGCN